MRITKVYTRTGDKGQTRLVGGSQVDKDDKRIEAYGTIDELNAVIGLTRMFNAQTSQSAKAEIDRMLAHVQNDLFNVGTDLATPAKSRWEGMHRVGDDDVLRLESWIDQLNADLEPLREFILPGGGPVGASLHQARTVCRRAERRVYSLMNLEEDIGEGCLRYLNRLSDFFFVQGRWAAKAFGEPEVYWKQPS
ncbi:MAG: cob(I)alamin adenosyltransferase [Kiritimatiellia bacterium]|jgi:cob(I)alamin adenosyltransferase